MNAEWEQWDVQEKTAQANKRRIEGETCTYQNPFKMTSKFIYINPQGVPYAPTRNIPDELVTNEKFHHIQWGSVAFKKEIINSCIPIREEDRGLIKDIAGDFSTHFKPDTFYLVEPYEFGFSYDPCPDCDEDGLEKGSLRICKTCDGTGGLNKKYAKIIRPSEPKADPKEKELYSIKPLEWTHHAGNPAIEEHYFARSPFGKYFVLRFKWFLSSQDEISCRNFEDGKRQAQDHFNSKLKLCLNREL